MIFLRKDYIRDLLLVCLSACDNDISEDMHVVFGGWMVMATCMFIPYHTMLIDFFWLTQK